MDSEDLPVPQKHTAPAVSDDQSQLPADFGDGVEGVSDVELLAARLRVDLSDIHAFVEGLAVRLEDMLPGLVSVERRKQGFRGPKVVSRIQISNGTDALELRKNGSQVQTVRSKVSGGITLKTEQLDIDTWLEAIATLIANSAAKSERARQALERLLLG